jgi:hypothetical protein
VGVFVLDEEGLAPAEVVPLLVVTSRRATRAQLGDIHVLDELDLSMDLPRTARPGPARIRGAAGTGKTVVALWRGTNPNDDHPRT